MHNWRLLLLAFVAVFHPIATYSEGLVDGRQRCNLRTAPLRDPGLYFHGTHRFTKPLEDRCLSQRDVRAVHRNELREGIFRSIKTPEKQLIDTFESRDRTSTRLGRSAQIEDRLTIENTILRRETRGAQIRSENRDQRSREFDRERLSFASDTRRNILEKTHHSKKLDDEVRVITRRTIASRIAMESRRDPERYRDNTKTQRAQEIRETRVRDDLTVLSRLGRQRAQEMRRAEFRFQQAQRQILNRRSKNTESRSSSISSDRVYRAYINEDSRRDTQSLNRDERLSTRSGRSFDGHNSQLDNRITYQDRVSAEYKIVRDSPQQSERRVLRERDALQLSRQRFVEARNYEWDRDTRLTRATRFEANRVSRDLRTVSLLNQRARSVENRRNVRDTRLIFRFGERSVENGRENRLADRASVTENRRGIRNINRESRVVTQNRAANNNREVRNIVRESRTIRDEVDRSGTRNINKELRMVTQNRAADSMREVRNIVRESREIRDDVDKENESCLLNRARLTDRRMTDMSRVLSASHDARNQRIIRNKERDTRDLVRERAEYNRNIDRESIFGRDRITERNIRMNLVDISPARKERSLENQRHSRNAEFQRIRVEQSSRRDIQNVERLTTSLDRDTNHRDTRENVRVSRTIEKRGSSETRANRDTRKDFRASAPESRRDSRNVERQSRQIGNKLIISDQRALLRERSAESQRGIRKVQLPQAAVNRRERATENRRDIRNINRDSRTSRSVEARIASRVNTENFRYYLKDRENSRITERLNMVDSRRSRSLRESNIEARRNFERNNMQIERREAESRYRLNIELARNREFLNTIQNTQTESETSSMNWQYLLYTLQGLYICGILAQLMNESTGKKSRALSWYSSPQHLIKVD